MRNPTRIQRITEKLRVLWDKNPDLRLGQLVEIIYSKNKVDKFYAEDDWLETRLNELIEEQKHG